MSIIQQYKIYFVAGFILILLGVVAAVYIFKDDLKFGTSSTTNKIKVEGKQTEETKKLSEQLNYPGSPQKEISEDWIYYKTDQGSIRIKNFFPKDYDPSTTKPFLITDNADYKIEYIADGDMYEVTLKSTKGNLQQLRQKAELELVNKFGTNKSDICQLPIFVYEENIDAYRPNKYNLGLTFCPLN